ncbi:hypothetical protein [Colwellia sp. UCD-KL20]|uniref:hypothetical protein n=1 Tax=Colwellia sp. UCD-KL20 TaxID=1917165 RepID=UPI000970493F|nr:hypothetical protein [Colwellia sp. UCD-KL20]
MEIPPTKLHFNTASDKASEKYNKNNNNTNTEPFTSQVDITESKNTKVTLSSKALTMLDSEKTQKNNANEQKKIESELAHQQYQEKTNDLPPDYRKMKIAKDQLDAEIKALKAEISKIKQSNTLNEEEAEQSIRVLEQQIADRSLAVIEIGKQFTQQLKDEERRKIISPEEATEMTVFFNSSPPEDN